MIEAPIPMGPLGLGPVGFTTLGTVGTPDCTSYSSSLAFSAIAGMSPEKAAKVVESDVVSHIIELQRPVNFLDFSIRKAKVMDRFGKEVGKEVLWSDDFGKSIQKATNAEEKGGQVWDLTDRLSDRVVNTSGESWHLVASPDGKEEGDNHRLIVVHNPADGSGKVREYFVTIRSSQNALKRLVENISGQNFGDHQDVSNLIVSKEKNKGESPITLTGIFSRFTAVLDDKERGSRHSFLEELKRDTHLSERELETRNTEVGKLVKREIKAILKDKPTLSALGLVAQSIPRWAGMVKAETRQISDNQASPPSGKYAISTEQKLPNESTKRDVTVQDMTKLCHCERSEARYQAVHGEAIPSGSPRPDVTSGLAMTFSLTIPERLQRDSTLSTTQRLDLKKTTVIREIRDRNDAAANLIPIVHGVIAMVEIIGNSGKDEKREMAKGDKQFIKQVIEPIVPIIVSLPIFFENMIEAYQIFISDNRQSKVSDKVAVESPRSKLRGILCHPERSQNDYKVYPEAELRGILLIKEENTVNKTGVVTIGNAMEANKPSDSQEISTLWQNVILPLLLSPENNEVELLFSDPFKKNWESLQNVQDEARDTKIYPQLPDVMNDSGLKFLVQNALERMVTYMAKTESDMLQNGLSEKEIIVPQKVESEIVNVGKDILMLFASEKEIFFSGKSPSEDESLLQESLTRLTVFISLYSDEQLRQDFKQYLIVLIYQEIQTLKFKEMLSSPFFAGLSEKVDTLEFISKPSVIARIPMLHRETWQSSRSNRDSHSQEIPLPRQARDRNDKSNHEVLIPVLENDINQRNFSESIFLILCLLGVNHLESNKQQKEVFLTEVLERIEFIIERYKFQNIYSIERLPIGEKTKIGQGAHFFPRSAVIYYLSGPFN